MRGWLAVSLIFLATPALAIDRYGAIGVGVAVPSYLEPTSHQGDTLYTLDFSFFMDEFWSAVLNLDFGLEGEQRISSGLGPRFFLFRDAVANPYLTALFLYSFTPSNDIGWRAALGVEVNLRKATKMDNLRFFAETGPKQFIVTGGNQFLIEWIRTGLSWSF